MENGRWVTINGNHVFVKDGQNPMDAFIKQKVERKRIGTINGEEIESFSLYAEEQGEIGEFTSLKDMYEAMLDSKRLDKKTLGYVDKYTADINTRTSSYQGYEIKKYKNKITLKK